MEGIKTVPSPIILPASTLLLWPKKSRDFLRTSFTAAHTDLLLRISSHKLTHNYSTRFIQSVQQSSCFLLCYCVLDLIVTWFSLWSSRCSSGGIIKSCVDIFVSFCISNITGHYVTLVVIMINKLFAALRGAIFTDRFVLVLLFSCTTLPAVIILLKQTPSYKQRKWFVAVFSGTDFIFFSPIFNKWWWWFDKD